MLNMTSQAEVCWFVLRS